MELKEKFLLNTIKIYKKTKIISSTGYISRELHQIRKNKSFCSGKDFYMVGGMGHSSSVALGFSIIKVKTGYLFRWRWSIINASRFNGKYWI